MSAPRIFRTHPPAPSWERVFVLGIPKIVKLTAHEFEYLTQGDAAFLYEIMILFIKSLFLFENHIVSRRF